MNEKWSQQFDLEGANLLELRPLSERISMSIESQYTAALDHWGLLMIEEMG